MARKVLIADDYQPVRNMLQRILERSGYQVFAAKDGIEALELFHREEPDLLITDLNMPHMGGYELCREIRGFSTVPIVITSAGSGLKDRDIAAVFELGADAFLRKPFDGSEVLAQIDALLKRN